MYVVAVGERNSCTLALRKDNSQHVVAAERLCLCTLALPMGYHWHGLIWLPLSGPWPAHGVSVAWALAGHGWTLACPWYALGMTLG